MANKTNCIINGVPYYRIRKKVGMKLDKHGKLVPDIKPFYGKNKTDAENQVKEYVANLKAGIKNEKSYFLDIAEYYTYNVLINASELASGSIGRYESSYRKHIKSSELAKIPMNEISSKDIQTYYNGLKKDGLSESSIKSINKYLSRFFKYVELEGYCKNPLQNVVVPKIEKDEDGDDVDEIVIFEDNEIELIRLNAKWRIRFLLLLAIGSGMRVSELMAIKYSDFVNGGVMVNKQLLKVLVIDGDGHREYKYRVVKPKSKSSIRFLPLPVPLLEEFKIHKEKHESEMKKNGYKTEFVFTTDSGNYIDKTNLRRAYKRFLKRTGIEEKKFHALRATYCTLLCRSGKTSLHVASKLMGHSDVSVTAKYYAFVTDKQKTEAVDKLNELFIPEIDRVKKGLNKPKRLKKH